MRHSIEKRSKLWLSIFVAVPLVGCARPVAPADDTLAQRIAGYTAGAPESCVVAEAARNVVANDPATLVYDRGSVIYINRLADACPGLRESSTIVVLGSNGGQYCRGDRFRTREFQVTAVTGPTCILGEWTPYRR
jgi:hypothetical protein